jgi:putative acetyltransferase
VLDLAPVTVRDPGVPELIDALTVELADGGYSDDETFGYSLDQLEESGVHLVGASLDGTLVGVGGVEIQDDPSGRVAELKRFYVAPGHRGRGVADAVIEALVEHARAHGATTVRLETGDRQHAAMRFYARHGFVVVPRFGPYVDSATSVCMQRDLDPSG